MTIHVAPLTDRLATDKPLSVAILAMGGQGGGVLSDWIVAAAETAGWVAQATSVPGVAQRTGATIYYIEMLPARGGTAPILSLMPTPGDVDVVLAAEFMEAGRSMLRGIVTPDRTTLIASTHRAYAVDEKQMPGNGVADPMAVVEAAGVAAKRIVAFDMQAVADANGSHISASMFGALAGADVLPFTRAHYEAAINAGGKGVGASLKAFSAAFDATIHPPAPIVPIAVADTEVLPATAAHPVLEPLLTRLRTTFPAEAHAMLFAGLCRVVDYQDVEYGDDYLDRMDAFLKLDQAYGAAKGFALTREAAKYLAVAMSYDDVIRVADLKTRSTRFTRVRNEVGVGGDQLLYMTEFMHPRLEEVAGTLPAKIGHALESSPRLFAVLDRIVNRGRRVKTGTILWFLALYALAGAKRFRRGTLRHEREFAHIAHWLDLVATTAPRDYDLAVETLACRRLVKGYSDTHARGQSKFDRVIATVPLLTGKPDGAAWLLRLKQAALVDEKGVALDGALKTVASAYD